MALTDARSIAVLRALPGIGDWLCAIPAVRALRQAAPAARIALVGLPSTADLVARYPEYVDELLPFPGHPGIPEVPVDDAARTRFAEQARSRSFDLAVQMHGNGSRINSFLDLLGAPEILGYRMPCAEPREGLMPHVTGVPEVARWTRLVATLGIPVDDRMEFPLSAEDRLGAADLLAERGVRGEYVCVHPGAANEQRRWSPEGFARVAEALAREGLQVVLTGSTAEACACTQVAGATDADAVSLCGQTTLGSLAGLVAGARLVLCNDTGVSHLAQALAAPSVVIFTGVSDPARWAPVDGERHRAVGPLRDEPDAATAAAKGHAGPPDGPALPDECGTRPCPVLAERPRQPHPVPVADVLEATAAVLAHTAADRGTHVA